jgi:hypothetical protein
MERGAHARREHTLEFWEGASSHGDFPISKTNLIHSLRRILMSRGRKCEGRRTISVFA